MSCRGCGLQRRQQELLAARRLGDMAFGLYALAVYLERHGPRRPAGRAVADYLAALFTRDAALLVGAAPV